MASLALAKKRAFLGAGGSVDGRSSKGERLWSLRERAQGKGAVAFRTTDTGVSSEVSREGASFF